MGNGMHYVRTILLALVGGWLLLLTAVAPPAILTTSFALAAALASVTLFALIPLSGNDRVLVANSLAGLTFGTAAVTSLVVVNRFEWLNLWSGLVAVLVSWGISAATVLWYYGRLITVPNGVMHLYNGLLRRHTVHGYAKVAPPLQFLERLRAVIPTRCTKVDVTVLEVGTSRGATHAPPLQVLTSTGPPRPERRNGVWNIHRINLAIEVAIVPDRWYMLLNLPVGGLMDDLRAKYSSHGRNAWHNQQFWAGLASGYTHEIAEEITRRVVYETGWSAQTIWHRRDEVERRIRSELQASLEEYGLRIAELEIVDVAIDEPLVLRQTRSLELFGDTMRGQQLGMFEDFQDSLDRLGLSLGHDEIRQLVRMYMAELSWHRQRHGHLDRIVEELLIERRDDDGPPRLRRAA